MFASQYQPGWMSVLDGSIGSSEDEDDGVVVYDETIMMANSVAVSFDAAAGGDDGQTVAIPPLESVTHVHTTETMERVNLESVPLIDCDELDDGDEVSA